MVATSTDVGYGFDFLKPGFKGGSSRCVDGLTLCTPLQLSRLLGHLLSRRADPPPPFSSLGLIILFSRASVAVPILSIRNNRRPCYTIARFGRSGLSSRNQGCLRFFGIRNYCHIRPYTKGSWAICFPSFESRNRKWLRIFLLSHRWKYPAFITGI